MTAPASGVGSGDTCVAIMEDRPCTCQLQDEIERLRAVMSDPAAVHINMLRGAIAKPSIRNIVHLYGADALIEVAQQMSASRKDGDA